MKTESIKIENFKTFNQEGISMTFSDLTALIGENSVGKSNILEAMELFFNFSSKKLFSTSFHHNDISKKIKIEITFHQLNEKEKQTFRVHLNEKGNLTITQYITCKSKDEKTSLDDAEEEDLIFEESKHGTKIQPIADLVWLQRNDNPPTQTNIKTWWKLDLKIGDVDFKELFKNKETVPTQEEYQEKVLQFWEQNEKIIAVEKVTGDEKVLGWKSKLKANLPKYFYIPAMKNLNEDLKVTSTSPLGELLNWFSKSISDEIKKDFKSQSQKLVATFMEKIDKDSLGNSKIEKINTALNRNLGLDIGCILELKFGASTLKDVVLPQPTIYANDGYESELSQKGHGVQRMAIFSLLRTFYSFEFDDEPDNEKSTIIGVEEPEIYLHPPVKRSTYKLLRKISSGDDQVIYTTHDSFFVSVEYFDEVRLFRKYEDNKKGNFTKIYEFPIGLLQKFYKDSYGVNVDEKSIRHRYYHIFDESKNESFFANKVILIEGDTEKYALPNYFASCGFDIDENRCSIITAGSVDSISYLLIILNQFGIPCYVIYDGDSPKEKIEELTGDKLNNTKDKSKRNKELYNLLGHGEIEDEFYFPETTIASNYTVWKYNFESEFHHELENYDKLKSSAKNLYGNDSKPLTARYISENCGTPIPRVIQDKAKKIVDSLAKLEWEERSKIK